MAHAIGNAGGERLLETGGGEGVIKARTLQAELTVELGFQTSRHDGSWKRIGRMKETQPSMKSLPIFLKYKGGRERHTELVEKLTKKEPNMRREGTVHQCFETGSSSTSTGGSSEHTHYHQIKKGSRKGAGTDSERVGLPHLEPSLLE